MATTRRAAPRSPGAPRRAADREAQVVALHDRAEDALAALDFTSAERLGRQALAGAARVFGPRSLDTANVTLTLARVASARGDLARAERLASRAHALVRGARGGGDVARLRLSAMEELASVLCKAGRFAEARPLARRALALAERVFGPRSPEAVAPLNRTGVICKFLHDFTPGGRAYRRALAIAERAEGPDSETVATLLHNLGGLEHARGRYARAEPFGCRAVEVRRRALGDEHPDVAADEAAYAAILVELGRFAEAERLHGHARDVFARVHGPAHYEVAFNERAMAELRAELGDAEGAERLFRQVVAKMRAAVGPWHPDLAMTLHNFAVFLEGEGRSREARPLYRRAIAIWERALGARHAFVTTAKANLQAASAGG